MNAKTLQLKRATRLALLTLLLCLAGLTNAVAQSFTVGNLNYSINEDGATVTVTGHVDGTAATGELVIPETVELYGVAYPVTRIGSYAFNWNTGLTGDLIIPNSVIVISNNAFSYCSGLSGKLTLGNSLTAMYERCFDHCGFTGEVTIPSSVTSIWGYIFGACSGITTLNYNAIWASDCCGGGDWNWLYGTSITTVNIGEGVRYIPCDFLNNVSLSVDHVTLPESVTHIGSNAFYNFSGSVNIPNHVRYIYSGAFSHCTGLSGHLNLPETLLEIHDYAFFSCTNLTDSLTIPNNVQWIGEYAFNGCTNLSGTLTLGASLESINSYAFFGIMNNVTEIRSYAMTPPYIGNSAFLGANATIPVIVPCSTIEDYQNTSGWNAFANIQESDPCQWNILVTSNLSMGGTITGAGTYDQGTTCTLIATPTEGWSFLKWTEDGVEVSTNATYAFTVEGNRNLKAYFTKPDAIVFADPIVESRCVELWDTDGDGLLSYEEAAAVTDLGYAFNHWQDITSFDELQYFTGLTYLNDWEFYYCTNMTSIILPEGLTSINYAAFEECYSLSSIVIPESVTYIGGFALSYCYALSSITILAVTPPELSDDCPFCNTNMDNVTITVPCNTTESYRNTYVWDELPNYQEPDDCIYEITVSVNIDEAGSVEGAGAYQKGTTCTLTAIPNEGCTFINWTENGQIVSTDAEYSFEVTYHRNLVANFGLPTFAITATANPEAGGTISFEGSGYYDFEDGTLQGWTSVDADGDGYQWEHVISTGNSIPGHNGSAGFLFSRSWVGYVLYPDNYLISPYISLGGSITFYACGQDAEYAAEHFGVAVSTSGMSPSDFTMLQEWTLTAKGAGTATETTRSGNRSQGNWYEFTVDLSNYAGQEGYVAIRHFNCYDMFWINIDDITINMENATYEQGQTCTMTAIPNFGYEFTNWTEGGNVVSTDAEYSFVVTADRDLVANFTKVPFAITATPNFDDRGTVSGAGDYVIDATCTLTATPAEGHNFVHWLENGEVVSTEATYAFTVTGPRDLVAVFTAPVADIIVFADPNVKAICVNNWDSDGDTELTYAEAAAVTNLNYAFNYNEYITSFDELQYFTGLTYINESEFYYCVNLTSVVIPNSVTYIGAYAFQECYSLTSITIPEGITTIESGTFSWCSSAETVSLPSTLESIGYWAFKGCNSLTSLELPSSLTYIGDEAFNYCSSLSGTLEIPSLVTYIGSEAFVNCSSLTGVVLPDNLQTIGHCAFENCSGLRGEITLPEALESVGDKAFSGCDGISTVNYNAVNCTYMGSAEGPVFYDCAFANLRIGENVENIPNFAFKRCFLITDMSVGVVTPPTIYASTFGSVPRSIPVHVPFGSGAAYRNAPYWEEFFNITEDYSPSQYTCHWNANPNQFEGNMTVTGIIQINGSEQATDKWEIGAFCGDECRGSQLLAHYPQVDRYLVFLTLYGDPGDLLTFRLYDHEANVESPLGCTTHLPFATDSIVGGMNDPYVFNFGNMQVTYLAQGWTWYSTYIEQDGNNGLEQLEESLDGNGLIIKSQANGYVTYSSSLDFWYGSLSAINNESAYLINTTSSCVVTMEGETATPSAHPISLAPGWTWIGYLPSAAMDINAALAGLSATEGDMLKTQHGFASYYPGYGWIGSLRTIEPGKGLMYKSNNSETLTLVYPDSNRGGVLRANLTPENNHWKPDTHAYPDNMSVMAVVELNGEEIMADGYELAAFDANGECRGSVEMVFVEPLNRYMAFLTLSGMDAVELHFGLYDAATGREYLDSDERVVFVTNAKVGDANEPYMGRFGELTGMSESAITAQVYPNPVARGERFSIDLGGSTTQSVRVEIVDALGAVTRSMTSAQQPVSIAAPAVSGVYLLRITVEGKGTCIKKLIVR